MPALERTRPAAMLAAVIAGVEEEERLLDDICDGHAGARAATCAATRR